MPRTDPIPSFPQSQPPDCKSCLIGALHAKEVKGLGPKLMILRLLRSNHCPCNGHKFRNHVRAFLCRAHRILRDICFARLQVIAGIEHAAVRIAPAWTRLFPDSSAAAMNMDGPSKCFASNVSEYLRAKVAKINHQGVAARLLHILQGLHHVEFAFHDTDWTFV